jgi:two-component system response regulator HydG
MQDENHGSRSFPMRFLVIEDREIIRKVLVKMLRIGGHQVWEASEGESGLEQVKCQSFDAVFTDLHMPGMTGWEVAREVKRVDPGCTVVVLTGFLKDADQGMLDACGIRFVLTKPFRLEKLTETVTKIAELREGNLAAPAVPAREEQSAGAPR